MALIWQKNDFQNAILDLEIFIFCHITLPEIKNSICLSNFVEIKQLAADILRKTIFKMAVVRLLQFSKFADQTCLLLHCEFRINYACLRKQK